MIEFFGGPLCGTYMKTSEGEAIPRTLHIPIYGTIQDEDGIMADMPAVLVVFSMHRYKRNKAYDHDGFLAFSEG